ncbi:six-cysteine peptide SCIFF [Clostridia bacterium]|nr:six-cysteine peptide SCIFF [Clostridia bacterium]
MDSTRETSHIKTIRSGCLRQSLEHGGCGECQASCQSACKTSCTVANQPCKRDKTADK